MRGGRGEAVGAGASRDAAEMDEVDEEDAGASAASAALPPAPLAAPRSTGAKLTHGELCIGFEVLAVWLNPDDRKLYWYHAKICAVNPSVAAKGRSKFKPQTYDIVFTLDGEVYNKVELGQMKRLTDAAVLAGARQAEKEQLRDEEAAGESPLPQMVGQRPACWHISALLSRSVFSISGMISLR